MAIDAVRVSKTSFKKWTLYGPIDQALKTSTQADEVKVVPIHIEVHGKPIELELWVNTEEAATDGSDELNPHAQSILQMIEVRKQGVNSVEEIILGGYGLPELPIVKGVAILTGAGGTDFPEHHITCTLAELVGQHQSEGWVE